MDRSEEAQEIEAAIRDMNRCWTASWDEGRFREFIHNDAVAIVPTTPGFLIGRDAYVDGWKGFVESATIHSWNEHGHRVWIDPSGSCAVVTYLFDISFSLGPQRATMSGRDMFFLVHESGKWVVIADQFSPEPALVPSR